MNQSKVRILESESKDENSWTKFTKDIRVSTVNEL